MPFRNIYCLNNPLAYTDPTGFGWDDIPAKHLKDIIKHRNLDCYGTGGGFYNGVGGYGGGYGYAGYVGGGGGYSYNYPTGNYHNSAGEIVSYREVYHNFITPNSVGVLSGDAAQQFVTNLAGGNDYSYNVGNNDIAISQSNYGGVQGLTLYTYYGYDPDTHRNYFDKNGAVVIKISYASTNGKWAQLITSNDPNDGKVSPYWDSYDGTQYYPYQWIEGNSTYMYDNPGRYKDCFWHADLFFEEGGYNITMHLSYGFKINNGHTTVEPIIVIPIIPINRVPHY